MAYATIALATDYDVWHEEQVSVDAVIAHIRNNVANVQAVLREKGGFLVWGDLVPEHVARDVARRCLRDDKDSDRDQQHRQQHERQPAQNEFCHRAG